MADTSNGSLSDDAIARLLEAAKDGLDNAYAPYSQFRVGAAVLTESGKIYRGSNVENASYGLSVCAERAAVFHAVCEGERNIVAVAVACAGSKPVPPCGACRQVITEFVRSPEQVRIYLVAEGCQEEHLLKDLLPFPFKF